MIAVKIAERLPNCFSKDLKRHHGCLSNPHLGQQTHKNQNHNLASCKANQNFFLKWEINKYECQDVKEPCTAPLQSNELERTNGFWSTTFTSSGLFKKTFLRGNLERIHFPKNDKNAQKCVKSALTSKNFTQCLVVDPEYNL